MKKNQNLLVGGLLLLGGLVIYFAWGQLKSPASPTPKKPAVADAAALQAGLDALSTGLARTGGKKQTSAGQFLNEAIQSDDHRRISQELVQLVYSSTWTRAQVIAVLKGMLDHPDAWVRVQAAEKLYLLGDASGRPVLIALMQRKEPLSQSSAVATGGSYDLRLQCADIAARFRDQAAAAAILDLYHRTQSRSLLDALVQTNAAGAQQILQTVSRNQPSVELMEMYGLLNARDERALIAGVQADPSLNVSIRLAAAWALARMEDDPRAREFLQSAAQGVTATGADPVKARKVIQYLGALNDAGSVQVLEQVATQSAEPEITRVAVANLALNHFRQSPVGARLIAEEFSGKITGLGIDLAVKLAAASSDPDLQKAGEAFDARRDGEKIWKEQGAARSQWSIWGWADDYILTKLND